MAGERVAGGADGCERHVEVLDLQDDLDPGSAVCGEALLGEAWSGAGHRELGDRAEAEDDVAPAEARVVVLPALDGEAEPA